MPGHKEKILKMNRGATKTRDMLSASYAMAWYSKEKPKTIDNKTGKMKPMKAYNHRAWRNFISSCFDSSTSTDKLLESGTVKKIDWKDPQEHAVTFAGDIERAKNITETNKANFQPLVYLEKAESQLSKVNSDLSGPRKYLVTAEILKQDGLKTIENVQRYITEISKKVSKSGRKR